MFRPSGAKTMSWLPWWRTVIGTALVFNGIFPTPCFPRLIDREELWRRECRLPPVPYTTSDFVVIPALRGLLRRERHPCEERVCFALVKPRWNHHALSPVFSRSPDAADCSFEDRNAADRRRRRASPQHRPRPVAGGRRVAGVGVGDPSKRNCLGEL